jgi:uncharacterized protein YndB with AHSA1/START domain
MNVSDRRSRLKRQEERMSHHPTDLLTNSTINVPGHGSRPRSTDVTTQNQYELSVSTPSDREIQMSRSFDAPRELVFKAFIDPELVPKWWGLRSNTTVIDKLDARAGGEWRFVQKSPDGAEYGFRGEFREVTPPELLTWTFEFEGMPGHVIVETMRFAEQDGVTTITTTSVFDSIEDRDGMINSGMAAGAAESYDRLAELLDTLA